MKNCALLSIAALCAACASGPVIPPGGSYSTPLGGMTCTTDTNLFPAQLQSAFGPHGGTLKVITDLGTTRVDVEEFSPTVDTRTFLPQHFDDLYAAYLNRSTIPLVKTGVPDARLVGLQADQINGHAVQLSALLLPQQSPYINGDGRREDGLRIQLIFTNGRFIYTMSEIVQATSNIGMEKKLQIEYARLRKRFATCSFKL